MSAACAPGEYEHGITGHGYHSVPVPGCRQLESPFVSAGEMTGGRDDVAERELAARRPLLATHFSRPPPPPSPAPPATPPPGPGPPARPGSRAGGGGAATKGPRPSVQPMAASR